MDEGTPTFEIAVGVVFWTTGSAPREVSWG